MRLPTLALLFVASAATVWGQAPQGNRAPAARAAAPAAQPAAQASGDANGVDTIISLVKANMSEALVVKTIQRQNKAYDLTPEDLVKLQKAGVSETIINAMLDPSSVPAAGAAAPAPAPAPTPAPATPPARPAVAPAAPSAPAAPRGAATQNALAASPARGAAAAKAPIASCDPQASSAAAAANQQKKPGGMFASFKDKMKDSAQAAVDGAGNSINCAANKGAQGSQAEVSSAMDSAVGTPGKKVDEVDANVSKATDVNRVIPNGNGAAANPNAATPVAKTPVAAAGAAKRTPTK